MKKNETTIFVNDMSILLTHGGLDDELNMDDLTRIDYGNLYGEAVTVSALFNKIGILKAEAEAAYERKKLECDIYESNLRKQWRRESIVNGGKFTLTDEDGDTEGIKLTEKSLDEAVLLDKGYQVNKKNVILYKENLNKLHSLFWSKSSKDKKLNNIMKEVTPEEFQNEIIEGKINQIMIRKHKPIHERKRRIKDED